MRHRLVLLEHRGSCKLTLHLIMKRRTLIRVTIAVSDGKGGTDNINVTINVTDVAGAAPSVETSPNDP